MTLDVFVCNVRAERKGAADAAFEALRRQFQPGQARLQGVERTFVSAMSHGRPG